MARERSEGSRPSVDGHFALLLSLTDGKAPHLNQPPGYGQQIILVRLQVQGPTPPERALLKGGEIL